MKRTRKIIITASMALLIMILTVTPAIAGSKYYSGTLAGYTYGISFYCCSDYASSSATYGYATGDRLRASAYVYTNDGYEYASAVDQTSRITVSTRADANASGVKYAECSGRVDYSGYWVVKSAKVYK